MGRVLGINKANTDDKAIWERAVEWAAADFGLRACPVFGDDILGASEEGIELVPLRCYTKGSDLGTILAASKRLTQLHPNCPNQRSSCRPWLRSPGFGGPTSATQSRPSTSMRSMRTAQSPSSQPGTTKSVSKRSGTR